MRISTLYYSLSLFLTFGLVQSSIAQYCSSGASSTADSGCDEVEIKGPNTNFKNNSSSTCFTYEDYTALPGIDMLAGQEYEISILTGTCQTTQYTKYVNAWIDFNGNGIFEHPGEALGGANGTPGNSGPATVKYKFTVPISAASGKTRLRVIVKESGNANNPCATFSWGDTEDYTANIIVVFPNDAGVSALNSPGIPVCSPLTTTFDAVVKNYGKLPLDSCLVHWMVNDSLQAPIKYVGTIAQGATGSATGTFYRNFLLGDSIKAWTTMPNGINDSLSLNDTLEYVVTDGLTGTYSVGGTLADFRNIDSAILAVNRQGICGHVVFELNNGSHIPTVALRHFFGSSMNGTLTFTSASNDRSLCFITDTSSSNNNNFAMVLDEPTWINFKEVTLSNGSSTQYSGVVKFIGDDVHHITFENCDIVNNYAGTSNNGSLIYSDEVNTDGLLIKNCKLIGGSNAVRLLGKGSRPSDGMTFESNEFTNQFISALDITSASNLSIMGNAITSNSTYRSAIAVYIEKTRDDVTIMNNVLSGMGDWPMGGVYITESKGNRNTDRIMVNNVFNIGDTASTVDFMNVSIIESEFWNLAHNTIVVQGKSTDAVGLMVDGGTGNEILNNIVSIFGSGQVINYDQLGSVAVSEGNSFYTETGADFGSYQGTPYINLADWQFNTGFDVNKSTSSDPLFYDRYAGDFRLCSPIADNTGLSVGISRDILSASRSAITPDPGAFEFASIQQFSISDASICDGDTAVFNAVVGANDTIVWNGSLMATTYMTSQAGMNTVSAKGYCGSVVDTFYVTINAPVVLPMDHNLCYGEDTLVGGNLTSASYHWNTGAMTSTIKIDKTGQYYVDVTDADGCTSSDTINVTVSGIAQFGPDAAVCEGTSVSLDPGTGAGTYTWTRNGVALPTASKIFADSAGTYVVTYSDQYGCSSSDSITITHYSTPLASFAMKPRTATTQNNFEFIADYKLGTNYYWSFGDGKSHNGPAWQTVNAYSQNGVYTVILTVSSANCGDSTFTRTLEIEGVGIADQSGELGISVYPNPSSGKFNIDLGEVSSKNLVIELKSLDGKVIQRMNNNQITIETVDVTNVVSGIYLVEIVNGNNVIYQGKLSIQN